MKGIRVICLFLFVSIRLHAQNGNLVFQTDFGVKDGAVAAMKGVAIGVWQELRMFDLTHEIPAFNIWEAAYRLEQTAKYWPAGTVFVSVVDPGVGSERKSIVAKTKSGHYIVTPDNGTLTLLAKSMGIEAVRIIDEKVNRLPGSGASHTFYGRDVFAYTGAKLAAKKISFEQVGPLMKGSPVLIDFQQAVIEHNLIRGNLPVLDVQYGNVWTNIPEDMIHRLGIKYGESLHVEILHNKTLQWKGSVPFVKTFTDVSEGKPLAYINSLIQLAFAVNQGNFSSQFRIASGPDWQVNINKF